MWKHTSLTLALIFSASAPWMKKSSFSSAFLSKMRSKIFSWKDPTNESETLIGICLKAKKHGTQTYSRGASFVSNVNLCTSILEVSVRLMSLTFSFPNLLHAAFLIHREGWAWVIIVIDPMICPPPKTWGISGGISGTWRVVALFFKCLQICLLSESVQIKGNPGRPLLMIMEKTLNTQFSSSVFPFHSRFCWIIRIIIIPQGQKRQICSLRQFWVSKT